MKETVADAPQLAACVAPEDLHCGDFVATLNVVYEYPSFFWCCDGGSVQPDEPVRIQFRAPDAGTPLKIKAICLPFIFVKCPNGSKMTLDVRKTQFVKLSPEYARKVCHSVKE